MQQLVSTGSVITQATSRGASARSSAGTSLNSMTLVSAVKSTNCPMSPGLLLARPASILT